MRGHRMSLVWLGYRLDELRTIRSTTIGAERGDDTDIDSAMRDVANAMCDIQALTPRQRRMVESYAGDLVSLLAQVERELKPSGPATPVIGHSCHQHVFIQNSDGVARAAALDGLTLPQTARPT